MKITHLVENLNRGGLERVVINLVRAQHAAGHECRVICLYEAGTLAHELTEHGVAVDACEKRPGMDFRALRNVRRMLREHRTEILHTHNIIAHDYAALASLGLGTRKLVNTRHGRGIAPPGVGRRWMYVRCMRWTDYVVGVCHAAKKNLMEHDGIAEEKIVVVPNGIHVERFRPASPEAHRRLAMLLGVREGTRLIGSVGRLNWAKDIPTMIRAFNFLRPQQPDSALVLIGDGSLRGELTQLAETEGVADAVHFLGDRGDVRDLLPGLDVLAMSSVSEGYSIALLEACASALPIVATDVGGNAEIVRDGVNGHIVAPKDPVKFAAALDDVLADIDRARAMGRAGYDWVRRYGSVETMIARYEALYEGRNGAEP